MVEDLAVQSANKLIGKLKVKYWIEDKGPIHQQIVLPVNNRQSPDRQPIIPDKAEMADKNNKPAQFQAALELELWKAQQEETFEKQLKQREKETLLKYVRKEFDKNIAKIFVSLFDFFLIFIECSSKFKKIKK